jgi:ATP-dependent Lon protease
LGKRYKNELWNGIGVVNGMAWTQLGGKVLTVEAVQYHSNKQKIDVTGQLGDVMK